jgi:hypothetical protein
LYIKRSRGCYVYAERVGVDSVAFILYDRKTQKFALIKESKPSLDTTDYLVYLTTAFGGSIDIKDTISSKEICQIEVTEEAGYCVPLNKIYNLGKTLVSSQMSQMCELFLVDITNIQKTMSAEWETSKHEKILWMKEHEILDNNDWKSIYILSQSKYHRII